MKTKISFGTVLGGFRLPQELINAEFHTVSYPILKKLEDVRILEDQTFDFFVMQRERRRRWEEMRKNIPPSSNSSVTIVKKGKFARRGCV